MGHAGEDSDGESALQVILFQIQRSDLTADARHFRALARHATTVLTPLPSASVRRVPEPPECLALRERQASRCSEAVRLRTGVEDEK